MSCALAKDQPGAKNGVPRWPEGAHQLHARYITIATIADFETAKRQITLDIVQHKGVVLSQWSTSKNLRSSSSGASNRSLRFSNTRGILRFSKPVFLPANKGLRLLEVLSGQKQPARMTKSGQWGHPTLPPQVSRYLLCSDLSGLPTLARTLNALPEETSGHIVVSAPRNFPVADHLPETSLTIQVTRERKRQTISSPSFGAFPHRTMPGLSGNFRPHRLSGTFSGKN